MQVILILFGVVAIVVALAMAFSPSKSAVLISSAILTCNISLLAYFLLKVSILLWVTPIFLILDLILLFFIFSTNLLPENKIKIEGWERFYLVVMMCFVSFIGCLVVWGAWNGMSIPEIDTASGSVLAYSENSFLGENWKFILLCMFIVAPASIGALATVGSKD